MRRQFPIVQKIVSISNRQEMISVNNSDSFLIHLDQFVIHVAPIYAFLKCAQAPKMNIHDCLQAILELIGKLLIRLGHIVSLSAKSYYNKLYVDGKPIFSTSKSSDIHVSGDNTCVNTAMEQLPHDKLRSRDQTCVGFFQ